MRFDIRYETRFRYDAPVRESHNELRACPVDDARQRVLDFRLRVDPAAAVQSYRDYWGTRVEAFGVIPRHDRLDVIAEISVETQTPDVEPAPATPVADLAGHEPFHEYLVPSRHTRGTGLADLGRTVVNGAGSAEEAARTVAAVGRPVADLHARGDQGGHQHRRGRRAPGRRLPGLRPPDRRPVPGGRRARPLRVRVPVRPPRRRRGGRRDEDGEADSVRVQTHAWVEVAVAPGRWLPLDPTNGRDVGERHVKIGHGRDYFDVTPFHGSFSGSADPTLVARSTSAAARARTTARRSCRPPTGACSAAPPRTPPSGSPPTRNSRSNSSSSPRRPVSGRCDCQ